MAVSEPKYHPLTLVAFFLALLILVLPVQADIVFVFLSSGRMIESLFAIGGTTAIVAIPLFSAQRDTKRSPEKWKPRFLTSLTWGIVLLNLVMNAIILINLQLKQSDTALS